MTSRGNRLTTLLQQRLDRLRQAPPMLAQALRGIEKEGLRVDDAGRLAMTPHPATLGSALTPPPTLNHRLRRSLVGVDH